MAYLLCDKCGKITTHQGSWDTPIKILCKNCSNVKKKISITYDNEITQVFNVIERGYYTNVIVPIKDEIYDIECKNNKQFKKLKVRYEELKSRLSQYGRFCTDNSPLYKSLDNGVLSLGPNQGGDHKVKSFLI